MSVRPSPEALESESLRGARPIPPYAVIACSVVFFWSISVRAIIYTVMPTIAADLQLSNAVAGLVISGMLLGYCAGSWWAGWLPSHRKNRIVAGVLLSVAGAILFGTASHLVLLLAAGFLVGLGVGIYLPLGLALLVEVGGSRRKAYYLSVHELAATLGSYAGSAAVAVVLLWTDWRGSVLAWCAIGVAALLSLILLKDPGGEKRHQGEGARVSVDATVVYSVISYGVGTILVMGLISMLPLILVRTWGLDQAEAASVVGNSRLAGLAGVIVAGLVADRWGHRRVLFGLQLLCVVGGAAMSVDGYGPLFEAGMMVLAAGASGNITLVPVVVAEAYPPAQRVRAMAVASGVGGLLGMVAAPALFGVLLDVGLGAGPIVASTVAAIGMILATNRIARRAED
ncbi:MAG: MFS transporter [Sphingomonadaceae bacterium]